MRWLNRRIAVAFAAIALFALLATASLLFVNAAAERRAIQDRALRTATSLSSGFDQEVAAVNYLLKGLATSPALVAGDIKSFHAQMRATQIPEGSWLILQDVHGQVANTLRQFGEPLPTREQMPNYDALIARLQARPWTVSGRLVAPLTGGYIVGLSLRIDGPEKELTSWLTTILAEPRLNALLEAESTPPAWRKVLYDRNLAPIVSNDPLRDSLARPAPDSLKAALADATTESPREGLVNGVDEHGEPILIAYRRSSSTDWTTVTMVGLAEVNEPMLAIVRRLAVPGLLIVVAGSFAAFLTTRQIQQPIRHLSDMVSTAQSEVAELSGYLLSLQVEEQKRIARELHDSTVQHLVATSLGMAQLANEIDKTSYKAHAILHQTSSQVQAALNELRVFAYLLHPPDLEREGLAKTVCDFVNGFGRRTGLDVSCRISSAVDSAPATVQLALLRVVQESLANVHRHARASRVYVGARVSRGQIVLRVHDDGEGMPNGDGRPSALPGVGIPGMRARLRQIGGDLRIATGLWGTAISARVPSGESGSVSIASPTQVSGEGLNSFNSRVPPDMFRHPG